MRVEALKLGPSDEVLRKDVARKYGEICEEIYLKGTYLLGFYTQTLEYALQLKFGKKTLAMSSATDCTEALLRAMGSPSVIFPALSFPSSVLAALKAGCPVGFVDVDWRTMTIDEDELRDAIKSEYMMGAMEVVFFASYVAGGGYANMQKLSELGATVVEDISHSFGAMVDGREAGMWGDHVVGSLVATKPFQAGTGGFVMTSNEDVFKRMEMMREYGRDSSLGSGVLSERGGSWRMSEMEAAAARMNMMYTVDLELEERRTVLRRYEDRLPNLFKWPENVSPNGYRASLIVSDYQYWKDELAKRDIGVVGRVYDRPVTEQPIFHGSFEKMPKAKEWCDHHICLPCYARLTVDEQNYVINAVKEIENEQGNA